MAKKAKATAKKTIRVAFVLDRSGSMESVREATIDGFNEYLSGLKRDTNADYRFSLTLFDLPTTGEGIEKRYVNVPIGDVEPLTVETYVPRGMTPLYDAVCATVKEVEEGVGKDEPVLVAILTDGYENSSKEYGLSDLRSLIERLTKRGNFTFTFMGANVDAFAEAQKYSIPVGNAMQFTADPAGTRRAMHAHSISTSSYAANVAQGAKATMDFYDGFEVKVGDIAVAVKKEKKGGN